jgi:1,2-diacylglycerol-3-alpha-glucose alpha-1,2-galactosyltransferase
MENKKITIRMLSTATSVSGQGVGSAYMEQVSLVKEQSDLFSVLEGKEKGRAQIYHVHTVNPTFRLRMSKKHVNVIYVHFLPQTLDGSLKMNKLNFSVFKHYVIHTYRKADEIVVVNPIFIEPLVKLGMKRENITYIPNYVSKENFHKIPLDQILALRKHYGIDPKAFVIMGCGQVQTRKGVKDYIQVAKDNPDITFVWAGGFSFGKMTDGYDELKAIMDNPPKNVHFIGIIDRTKMNDIFNMCDVLFMPSFDELFPMSILEAANSAKPILLRNLELYQGILWDNYAAAPDVKGFDEQVRKLKEDPAYYKIYSDKATNIATFYSKEHVGELWREYYPRILAKWAPKKHLKW